MLFTVLLKKVSIGSDVMKKHFNKELVITKKDSENFKTLLNAGFVITIIQFNSFIYSSKKQCIHRQQT